MKLKALSLVMAMVICISFIGCAETKGPNENQIGKQLNNILSTPDKIVIHSMGKTKELDKNSSQFKKIVQLTNGRFHDKLSTIKDVIDDKIMEDTYKDGLGIEFIYEKEQDLSITGDGFLPFKYYKLYFQLTSEKSGSSQGSMVNTLQYGDEEHYKDCSRGPLKYSEELIELVEKLK